MDRRSFFKYSAGAVVGASLLGRATKAFAADDGSTKPAVVAIIRSTIPLKTAERDRIQQWLRVRLAVDDVTVIPTK